MEFKFMQKVAIDTGYFGDFIENLECLFIGYYKPNSGCPKCLLHCPKLKKSFYYPLERVKTL